MGMPRPRDLMSTKSTSLLNFEALDFRPYEKGEKGWFINRHWSNGKQAYYYDMVFLLDGDVHRAEEGEWIFRSTTARGEFAGPLIPSDP